MMRGAAGRFHSCTPTVNRAEHGQGFDQEDGRARLRLTAPLPLPGDLLTLMIMTVKTKASSRRFWSYARSSQPTLKEVQVGFERDTPRGQRTSSQGQSLVVNKGTVLSPRTWGPCRSSSTWLWSVHVTQVVMHARPVPPGGLEARDKPWPGKHQAPSLGSFSGCLGWLAIGEDSSLRLFPDSSWSQDGSSHPRGVSWGEERGCTYN